LEECLYDTGTDVHPALSVTDLQNCAMLAAAYWSTRGGISMHDALNRLVLGVRPLNPYWGQLLAQVADRLMDDMSTKIERIVGPGKPPAKPPERPTWVHFDAYSRGR